jgi:hypothetical protein
MAESNLRSLLATARSGGNTARHDAPVGDAEMAAILGVLRGDEGDENGQGGPEGPADITEPSSVAEPADVVAQPPTAAG